MNRTTFGGVRRLAVLVVLGVLGSLLTLGLDVARPAPARAAGPVAITDGAVTWGIKESWRRYIGAGSEAGDGATVTGRTQGVADGFTFPVASGSFDPETGTTTLALKGYVHFRSWYEYHEPGKWALDTKFSDLRLVIGPDVQEIRGTHTGYLREDPGGDLHEDVDVVIARLDVGQASTDFTGGTASWSDLPAIAGPGFSIYTEGTPLDRVAFSYTGPGAVPDLGEHFDRPGVPVLKAGAEWLSRTTERSSAGGGQALELSTGDDVVFAVNISHTSGKTVFVTAHDPVTLAPIGEPFTFQPGARTASARARLVHGFDPDTDTLFFQTFREGAESRDTTVRSVHWDAGSRTFTAGVVGTLTPRPASGTADLATGPMVWNRVTQELLVTQAAPYPVADVLEQDNLFRFTRDGSGWTRAVTPLRFPGTGAYAGITSTSSVVSSTAVVPRQNIGVFGDGSYLVATGPTRLTTANGSQPWPALRVRFDGDGKAVAEPVAGTVPRALAEDFGGAYYGFTEVTPGADGALVLHGDDQSLDAFVPVRLVDGAAVAGTMAVGTDVLPPYEISVLGSSMAYDAGHDVQWAYDYANTEGKPLGLVEDGEVVASYAVKDFASAYFSNQYLRVAEDGAVYVPIADVTSGRFGWRRYAFLGVAPKVTQQPADASVELGVGESSEQVTFSAAASGGDLQWQVRNPGESRFTDLAGEHGATLTLQAGPSYDGRTYRLLVTNDAGRVASAEATLSVRFAPRVTADLRDASVTEGADASFVVAADANPAATVTWQRRVGGFWESIAADDDDVVVETVDGTSSLRVSGTNTDQSGSLFRARLRNDAGTVLTRTARLTVQPKVTIPAEGLALEGVVLEWSGSAEVQSAPPFGGSNYLSAGVSDGDEATYRVTEGDVTVVHRAAGGAESAPTWGTRAAQVAGGVEQLVRLSGGDAELAADGSGTVRWYGTWSVNFYGGLVPFWLADPELRIDADGTAELVADLDGYGSSQGNPEQRDPLEEVEDVTVATFSDVAVDPAGRLVVQPEYAGREVALPASATPQSRTGAGWGAWPQEMVDFQLQTGLSSYWYSSGGAADGKKAPSPVVVDFRDAEQVTGPEPEPEPVDASVRVSLADSVLAFNTRPVATVRVSAPGATPTGVVAVRLGNGAVVRARLTGGAARVVLPGRPAVGRHAVTASYAGDEHVRAGSGRTTLTVTRVLPRVAVVTPRKVRKGAPARVKVRVVVPGGAGAPFRGQVAVLEGGRVLAVRTVTAASGATLVLTVPRSTVRRLRAGVHYWSAVALATPSTLRATSRLVPVRVRR
ncbi:HtaA domain-containing protein [Nocardioides sp. LML1-1-1.1]|uniref:HtaA domain-containing protein n=1 Tax=Nocardioides sp. LML1-1-1.1 TaxID=3135248 RepID=UPI00344252ED